MSKTFSPGVRVRLTEEFHGVTAGTEYEVVEMVKPGFFLEGVVKVKNVPELPFGIKSVPIIGGMSAVGFIHRDFLEEVAPL